MKIGLIGYGYWGKNLFRNLMELSPSFELIVAETSEVKRNQLKAQYPNLLVFDNADELLELENLSAVVIAAETSMHYQLAKKALFFGKHVLVEKPITTSLVEAEELVELAKNSGKILMVDHVFLYHPAVMKMKEYFKLNELGKINYIDSTRVNLGIYQQDVNVLWDLACHDIAIINFLVDELPQSVRAIGRLNQEHGAEDIAYLFLYYPSGILVQINSSWASPVKMRKMIVGGEKKMLIYDDIEPSNKLTIFEYEHNYIKDESKSKLTDYRLGNIIIPKFESTEALKNVLEEFVRCILTNSQPLASGESALPVVNILEKAQQSLNQNGTIIPLF